MVQMHSDLGNKPQALAEVDRIWERQRTAAPGYQDLLPGKIDYLQGNVLFWYDDLMDALDHLKKAAAKAGDLDLNTAIMPCVRSGPTYSFAATLNLAVA